MRRQETDQVWHLVRGDFSDDAPLRAEITSAAQNLTVMLSFDKTQS